MRYYFITLFLVFALAAWGQQKDKRALLDFGDDSKNISVSPTGEIWVASFSGNVYYTVNIDSNWHCPNSIFKGAGEGDLSDPKGYQISYFNKDTAILTGEIQSSNKRYVKDGYYLTRDGGQTWALDSFENDSWIQNVVMGKNGKAWIGGSSGNILFSDDFGQQFKKVNWPSPSDQPVILFMQSDSSGVACFRNQTIYLTTDNWNSAHKLPTAFDQNKNIKIYKNRAYDSFHAALWNNYLVLLEEGALYYTPFEKIDWKPFDVDIRDFEIDKENNRLIAITNDFNVVSFSSLTECKNLTNGQLDFSPYAFTFAYGAMYIMGYNNGVGRIDSTGTKYAMAYTNDKVIETPEIVKRGDRINWGITGNQLYLSETWPPEWYREKSLDFWVNDLKLINDSTAILWNRIKGNYKYSLKSHTCEVYNPKGPRY